MGRFDEWLSGIRDADLRAERDELIAQKNALDARLALVDHILAVKEPEVAKEAQLPPLSAAITRLFEESPQARDTDGVMEALESRGWLGGRERTSVNATLGRMVQEGVLHRVRHGYYDWGPGGHDEDGPAPEGAVPRTNDWTPDENDVQTGQDHPPVDPPVMQPAGGPRSGEDDIPF